MIIVLINNNYELLYSNLNIVQISPLHILDFGYGIWFYANAIFCYSLIIVILFFILIEHKKLPSTYQVSSVLYVIGFILPVVCNIATIAFKLPVNISVIGTTISIFFVFTAIYGNADVDFLLFARNDIFNYLEEYIFILDNYGNVVDANASAMEWLDRINFFETKNIYFPDIFEHLENMDARISKNKNANMGIDILLLYASQHFFYNVKENDLVDYKGVYYGKYVSFLDISRYKMMISKLEKSAGIDSLTGLSNRVVFDHNKIILDSYEYFPLCIILGDVNGLKAVNDNYGHQYGDLLLKVVAVHIKKYCPGRSTITRAGGDEFYILLPNTEEIEARTIMNNIQLSLDNENQYPFNPSISLGLAIKREEEEVLDELIHEADLEMYKQKGDRRRQN